MNYLSKVFHSPLFTGWLNRSVNVLRLILFTPLLLSNYDSVYVASYYLFFSVGMVANLLSERVVAVFTKELISDFVKSEEASNSDSKCTKVGAANFNALKSIQRIVPVPLAILGGSYVAHGIGTLTSWSEGYTDLWACLAIVCVGVVWNQMSSVYRAVLSAKLQVIQINRVNLCASALSLLLAIIILIAGFNIFYLILVQTAVEAIRNCVIKRRSAGYIGKTKSSYEAMLPIFKKVRRPILRATVVAISTVGVTRLSAMVLVRDDPNSLASFLLCQNMLMSSFGFAVVILHVTGPFLMNSLAKEDTESVRIIMQKRLFVSIMVVVCAVVSLTFIGPFIVELSKSSTRWLDMHSWVLFSVSAAVVQIIALFEQTHNVTNEERFFTRSIVSAAISLTLLVLLQGRFTVDILVFSIYIPAIIVKNVFPLRMCAQLSKITSFQLMRIIFKYPSRVLQKINES